MHTHNLDLFIDEVGTMLLHSRGFDRIKEKRYLVSDIYIRERNWCLHDWVLHTPLHIPSNVLVWLQQYLKIRIWLTLGGLIISRTCQLLVFYNKLESRLFLKKNHDFYYLLGPCRSINLYPCNKSARRNKKTTSILRQQFFLNIHKHPNLLVKEQCIRLYSFS